LKLELGTNLKSSTNVSIRVTSLQLQVSEAY